MTNKLPVTQFYVVRGHIGNEETSFNPFPGTAKTEGQRNLENL